MQTGKSLGIWLDHSNAHLTEFTSEPMKTIKISSTFTQDQKSESLSKSENVMHNKEQHLQSDFYKKIGDEIKNYDRVILFGPTNAKAELVNKLKEDHHFSKISIEVKQMDKMTENQEHAFVREYFS
jgi:stalled ribosome rescue protein Dom34